MEPTLEDIGRSVTELRQEMKKALPDQEKIERINSHLDTWEEKYAQPLTQAQQRLKDQEEKVAELSEQLEQAGVKGAELKGRIEQFELELARRAPGGPDQGDAWKQGEEYKALQTWAKDGLTVETKQLLRTDSDVAGGFLVPQEMDDMITKKITEIDPIRSISRVRTVGSKTIQLAIRNTIPAAEYEGEAETGTDSVSSYQAETVTPFRQTFTSPITMDQLMDAAFDMEAEISSDASEAFAFGEGQGFVSGTGFKQPEGFVQNAALQAAARDTAASGVLDPESIILLTGDLKVGYEPVYVLNRRTLALIRTFRADAVSAGDSASAFLWQPGLNGPVSNTINGFPYVLANSMPDVAAGAFAIAFGDFRRGYTIIDRTGMSVIRDEVTQKKRAIVEFTMNRWNTGRVVLLEPIRLLRVAP